MLPAARSLLALLLAALALLMPGAALADERILSWRSDIDVRADGALDITETIRVNVEGYRISRGIFRDFPTTYERDGRPVRVGFAVESVERDGRPEPYVTEGISNGVRVRIGDADIYLPHGEHTYVIRYETTRQLGFFDGFDELYWNVTGTDWAFPIDRAEVRVRLPEAVPFGPERAFYTGPQGATDGNAEVVSESPGEILIRTTAPLASYEGLTVAVRWPKGVVAEPAKPTATQLRLQEEGPRAAVLPGILGLLAYYFLAWKKVGRGPRAGTVVPLFAPPEGLSAAALRYVKRMGFDNRCFAAAIVESGVLGALRIEEGKKGLLSKAKTTLFRTGQGSGTEPAEQSMLTSLFAGSDSIELDDANHARFSAAQDSLKRSLESAYKGKTFEQNLEWAWAGFAFLFMAMLLVASAVAWTDLYTTALERSIPAIGLGLALVAMALRYVPGKGWPLQVFAGLCSFASFCLLIWSIVLLASVLPFGTWGWVLAPLLALPLMLSAFAWMAAPTTEGRAVMDRIAGFEQYLSITEESRLEALHPPEKTPELFERYLPHAIALGVENRWASKFAAVLAAAAADPSRQGRDNTFGWYSGSSNAWSNPARFAGAVGASLASSVASASTAPGSSSGSGGGGSSGGGGGGGGGGGW